MGFTLPCVLTIMADEGNGSWKAVYFAVLTFSLASDGLMSFYVSQRSDEPARLLNATTITGRGVAPPAVGNRRGLTPFSGATSTRPGTGPLDVRAYVDWRGDCPRSVVWKRCSGSIGRRNPGERPGRGDPDIHTLASDGELGGSHRCGIFPAGPAGCGNPDRKRTCGVGSLRIRR